MMGYASFLVWRAPEPQGVIHKALCWYGAQLCANFLWSPLFFSGSLYLAALLWLVCILLLIVGTIRRFAGIHPRAGWLLVPYLCWCLFATYLNAGVWVLNR